MIQKNIEEKRIIDILKIINPYEAMGDTLSGKTGYDVYTYIDIMRRAKNDQSLVSDKEFQSEFKSYYFGKATMRISPKWEQEYFQIFEDARNEFKKNCVSTYALFSYLIKKISSIQNKQNKDSVERSFTSKMVHTINNHRPIIDSHVYRILQINEPYGDYDKKIQMAIDEYECITDAYRFFLDIEEEKNCVEAFDRVLPMAKKISDYKKLDFLIWGMEC